ncbi:hypothetical protein, conserved [Babesia ovata]|uniref:Extracellular matrix-binding ebh n=1 Tax=Babesia ovata TaxID=189622 RepID=A0A2H6KKA0_9APIC|nr:uncharacterized protein BOVATA_049180 [Babesia ovata]GBE63425.1 hypothetical protein, conserved [Babesia ovata]
MFLLKSAIAEVSAALQAWSGELEGRKKAFQEALSTLKNDKMLNMSTALKSLDSCPPDKVTDGLLKCILRAGELEEAFSEAEIKYKTLDSSLKNKLLDNVRKVEIHVKTFVASASSDELRLLVDMAAHQLDELRGKVHINIEDKVRIMEANIHNAFKKDIQDPIDHVKTKLEGVYRDLGEWIRALTPVLEAAQKLVDEVIDEVDQREGKANGKPQQICVSATNLRNDAMKLHNAITAARGTLSARVIIATATLDSLEDGLKGDLKIVKDNVKAVIKKYVAEATSYFEEIKNNTVGKEGDGTKDGIMKHWSQLQWDITQLVNNINGNGFSSSGLKGIKYAIRDYANGFGGKKFDTVMQEWIRKIVDDDGTVKHRLGEYWRNNGSHLNVRNLLQLQNGVKQQIKIALTDDIQQAGKFVSVTPSDNVDSVAKNIEAIRAGINEFVRRLDDKHMSPGIDAFVQGIAINIERAFGVHDPNRPGYHNDHLQSALESIVAALYATIRQVSEELRTFTSNYVGYNLGTSVQNAIKGVEDIKGKLTNDDGNKIDKKLQLLKENIKQLGTALDGDLQKQVDEHIGKDGDGVFAHFNQIQLNQLTTFGSGHKGQKKDLCDAIKDIECKVTESLGQGEADRVTATTLAGFLTTITSTLGELCTKIDQLTGKEGLQKPQKEGLKQLLTRIQYGITQNALGNSNDHLTQINQRINDLIGTNGTHNTLSEILKNAKAFKEDVITEHATKAIDDIKLYVSTQVADATKAIQYNAKEQYYTKISKLFDKMKRRVDKNIKTIITIITNDSKSGVKGLLMAMNDHKSKLDELKTKESVKAMSPVWNAYLDAIFKYLKWQVDPLAEPPAPVQPAAQVPPPISGGGYRARPKTPTQQRNQIQVPRINKNPQSNQVTALGSSIDQLFVLLERSEHFDGTFQNHLAKAKHALSRVTPMKFTGVLNPVLLDVLKSGVQALLSELGNAYVSTYSMRTPLPGETDKYAKIVLTITPTLVNNLTTLKSYCLTDWQRKQINLGDNNPLGPLLSQYGFQVSSNDKSQEGHLRNTDVFIGSSISILLTQSTKLFYNEDDKKPNDSDVLANLHRYLREYYQVSHHATFSATKAPTTVNQMLQWCSGLRYNYMYPKVTAHVKTLFAKPEEYKNDDYDKIEASKLTLSANKNLSARIITDTLTDVCTLSHSVLTAFLGYGHADGIYACDHFTNSSSLAYPSSPSQCFDTLSEILHRLYQQLNFLFTQCSRTYDANTWRDCWYGSGIGGSSWECNKTQCANQECNLRPNQKVNQNGNQSATQTATQTCDQHPKCGLKSPLQSFLEDGLQGFLPHQFTKPGCKSTCTVSNHRGIPCKTPMGFGDIATTSSHTKTGAHLRDVLSEFCGDSESPLTKLCSLLTCLSQRTPRTLDDLFAFYFCYLHGWNTNDTMRNKHQKGAFDESVRRAYFNKQYDDLDVTPMFKTSSHTPKSAGQKSTHLKGDLFSVHRCDYDGNSEIACGRYLQPMGMNIWNTFSNKNADKYLSWIVYLTETFYDLLKKLYDECCNNCDKPGTRCHDKICPKTCPVKYTDSTADIKTLEGKHHTKDCKSIANCPLTRPTLCKYGFVLQSPHNLSGNDDVNMRRTCKDFCQTLERALDKTEAKAHALAKQRALDDIDARRISLGQLAGQLSGFIGSADEVKDAILNGLQSNVNQLEKLLKTSCGDKGCCKYNDDVKNQLNDANETLKKRLKDEQNTAENLVDILSKCNLYPSDGPLNELNEEIPKKIEKLNKSIEELKSQQNDDNKSKNASEIDKLNKDLQSHNASKRSLETLNQLCDFAKKIQISSQNNPHDLLDKLCTGLQTFLGFNETSKGYDGTGIVYSDLDRLCDGVMAFLHGVLHTVKEDESVKKYDGYIKLAGEKDLHNVLHSLQSSIGQGRSVFGDRVKEVNDRTTGVSYELGKYVQDVSRQQDKPLKEQLDNWTKTVEDINTHIKTNIITNVNNLDPALSDKIKREIEPVRKVVEQLGRVAGNPFLGDRVRKVDDELSNQKQIILNHITGQSDVVQNTLERELQNVFTKIESLHEKRREELANIRYALRISRESLETELNDLNGTKRGEIYKKFEELREKLKSVNNKHEPESVRGMSKHKQEVENIRAALLTIGDRLGGHITELSNRIHDAEKLRGEASGKVKDAADRLKERKDSRSRTEFGENIDKIVAANKIVSDVNKSLITIDSTLSSWILRAGQCVTEAVENVSTILQQVGDHKDNNREMVKNAVQSLKQQSEQCYVNMKEREFENICNQAKYNLENIGTDVSSLVDEKFREVQQEYKMWATGNIPGSRGMLQPGLPQALQSGSNPLLQLSNAVKDAANTVNTQSRGSTMQQYQSLRYSSAPSPSDSLSSSLAELQRLESQVQQIGRHHGMHNRDQLPSTDEVSRNMQNLSHLAYLIRKVVNDAIDVLSERISRDVQSATIRLSQITDFSQFTTPLSDASEFANRLSGQLRSQFHSQFSRLAALSTIQHAYSELSILESSVKSFGTRFSSGKKFIEEFDTGISNHFDSLVSVVGNATGKENNGLKKHLEDELKNIYFKKPGKDTTSIHKIYGELNAQKEQLGGKAEDISGAVEAISKEIRELGIAMKGIFKDDLSDKLEALRKKIGHVTKDPGSLQAVHGELQSLYTKEFTNQAAQQLNGMSSTIQQAIKRVLDIVEKLEDVPGDVAQKQKDVDNLLEQLRDKVQNNIKYVDRIVDDAERGVIDAIHSVENAARGAKKYITEAVTSLRKTLLSTTEQAFKEITRHVQILFSASHIADLQALRALVDQQLREVQTIIARDAVTGVKGMLKVLHGIPITAKSAVDDKNNLLSRVKNAAPSPTSKPQQPLTHDQHSKHFRELAFNFQDFVVPFLEYAEGQVKNTAPDENKPPTSNDQSTNVATIRDALKTVLYYVGMKDALPIPNDNNSKRVYLLDHAFYEKLQHLQSQVHSLSPSNFHGFHNPLLLDALRSGMSDFTEQLSYAYVNRYSGRTFGALTEQKPGAAPTTDKVLSTEGRNCAKVCLTILERVSEDLDTLKERCKYEWHSKEIHRISGLGAFLNGCGYIVSDRGMQDGELRRHDEMTGEKVFQKLTAKLTNTSEIDKHLKECDSNKVKGKDQPKKDNNFNLSDLLSCLHHHLEEYYSVGHYATFTSKRQPCSVYEMLVWCAGLTYNPVNSAMRDITISELFEDPNKQDSEEETATLISDQSIDASPHPIRYNNVVMSLGEMCSLSYDVLTRVLGTGDEHTVYASDFCNNSHGFKYPGSGKDCLDMLLDILRRLFPPLKFLLIQCSYPTAIGGWSQCQYGKEIPPAKWPCSDHSNSKPKGQPKGQATDQPNTEPNCQPKSPLQSYLNDCLPGSLPHRLIDIGCRAKCSTCPASTPGMPCLTPLGFKAFSGSTRTGRDLCNMLEKFFNNAYVTSLFCLLPKPPSTLAEHFSFVLSLLKSINASKPNKSGDTKALQGYLKSSKDDMKSLRDEFDTSISKQSITLYKQSTDLTSALTNAYRSTHTSRVDKNHLPQYADLSSLAMEVPCKFPKKDDIHCAPYLNALCDDTYTYLAHKNSKTYLSWAIYLPWTFWDLLNNLYNAFCAITCADWGCRGCLRGDKCRSGKHGVVEDEKKPDDVCQCSSIVSCRGVAPTLYQYGFSFGEASTLNDGRTAKKCKDFCSQLHNVLHSDYFDKLFKECDNFLYYIRWPFMTLLLALWSLSLLYLLHIAVVRLDVLRIRSHLRSPSSHRIAAQSLLAAGRIKALANVKYFSP